MAEGVLSFPFRLTPQGDVAVTGYGTDQEVDEAIAALVLTMVGERPMSPEYGIPDPGFAGLHTGDVQVGLDEYGPTGVTVQEIVLEPVTDAMSTADIRWARDEDVEDY